MSLAKKVKVGLDETRILILGTQILLGFGFQLAFQQGFQSPSQLDASLNVATAALITLTTGLIISPSAQHRIVEQGNDTLRLLGVIRRSAGYALAPLAVALGIDVFLVVERVRGSVGAVIAGTVTAATAAFFWYGYAFWKRHRAGDPPPSGQDSGAKTGGTSLEKKTEQMLTEARVILPGAQALLGFQLIIVFSEPFEKLAPAARLIHLGALGSVALSAVWLMAPAACHRIAFDGADSEDFLRLGTRFLLGASAVLAIGIATDLGVVVGKLLNATAGFVAGGLSAATLIGFWLIYPLILRGRSAGSM